MADFFDDLGKKLSEAASEFGKKTEDTIEIQKIKSEIRSLRRANDRDYVDMGKSIYTRYQQGEVLDADLAAFCEQVEKRELQIKDHEAEIAGIKGEQE